MRKLQQIWFFIKRIGLYVPLFGVLTGAAYGAAFCFISAIFSAIAPPHNWSMLVSLPVLGILFGGYYGALSGMLLGVVLGVILSLSTAFYPLASSGLRNYQRLMTVIQIGTCAMIAVVGGILFSANISLNGLLLFWVIPAIIATLVCYRITRHVTREWLRSEMIFRTDSKLSLPSDWDYHV